MSFVRAAIASSILRGTSGNGDVSGCIAWIREHVDESVLAPLMTGSIVVELADAASGSWEMGFEFIQRRRATVPVGS